MRCNSSLSFFNADGMRFHLPAFLIAELKGEYRCGIEICLTSRSVYSSSTIRILDTFPKSRG